jgi:hypothetical protein
MWIFPFRNYYLKTSVNRAQIHQKILEHTFLSDAGYRKEGNSRKLFYGTASDELFSLQTINDNDRLVPYIEGEVKGVGHDIYLFLNFKAFRYRRIYVLIFLFGLAGLILLVSQLASGGLSSFQNAPFLLLSMVMLSVCGYIIWSCIVFWRIQKKTLNFFCELLEANPISYSEVHVVFKL